LTHDVIGSAIEVHKDKGPGLLESIYEWSLTKELELRGHKIRRGLTAFHGYFLGVPILNESFREETEHSFVSSVFSCSHLSVFVLTSLEWEVISERTLQMGQRAAAHFLRNNVR
jgi:hypothetical protein